MLSVLLGWLSVVLCKGVVLFLFLANEFDLRVSEGITFVRRL